MSRHFQTLARLLVTISLLASLLVGVASATVVETNLNHSLRTVNATALSTNWSGYSIEGKDFKRVEGTFTVPACAAGGGIGNVSEWVGIDGFNNEDLLQAGVDESGSPGSCYVYAWWEDLPSASVPIAWMDVRPGDQVEVGIGNFGADTWGVTILDEATGQMFEQQFIYNGPDTSAEWIVEAPSVGGYIANVLPFQAVTWTGLSLAGGRPAVLTPIWLVQAGRAQVIPSSVPDARALMKSGFTDEYVGGSA